LKAQGSFGPSHGGGDTCVGIESPLDPWQAAGYLGMSVKVLIDTYGHHHPDYMKEAADAITSKDRTKNVSVVETVVELNRRRVTPGKS
jgi:hypothetical protein